MCSIKRIDPNTTETNRENLTWIAKAPLDVSYKPRPWACDHCRYVLGVVMRDHHRLRSLYVFLIPFDGAGQLPSTDILMSAPRGLYRVPGMDRGYIECGHCGHIQLWEIGESTLSELIERRRRRSFGLSP